MNRSLRISITDLQSFHSCPRAWYWNKKYGSTKEPQIHLLTGAGVHAGLEGYYRAGRDSEAGEQEFLSWQKDARANVGKSLDKYWSLYQDQFENATELSRKMLKNFFEYDLSEKPELLRGEIISTEQKLEYEILPGITIVMKSDLVLRDARGHLWLIDHKTYSREPDVLALDVDDQLTGYAYLYALIKGETPYAVMHNVLYKNVPEPPAILSRGGLSKAKSQATTYALYVKALEDLQLDVEPYEEILSHLKSAGWGTYFNQFVSSRNMTELEGFESRLVAKASDIARAVQFPQIWAFPNPNPFQCGGCPYRTACKSANDGGDFQAILRHHFTTDSLY